MDFHSHELVPGFEFRKVRYELKPVFDAKGNEADGVKVELETEPAE